MFGRDKRLEEGQKILARELDEARRLLEAERHARWTRVQGLLEQLEAERKRYHELVMRLHPEEAGPPAALPVSTEGVDEREKPIDGRVMEAIDELFPPGDPQRDQQVAYARRRLERDKRDPFDVAEEIRRGEDPDLYLD